MGHLSENKKKITKKYIYKATLVTQKEADNVEDKMETGRKKGLFVFAENSAKFNF